MPALRISEQVTQRLQCQIRAETCLECTLSMVLAKSSPYFQYQKCRWTRLDFAGEECVRLRLPAADEQC